MLIIETTSNGTSIVKFKKDWHPNRIGKAYAPNRNYVDSRFMEKLQGALLVKRPTFHNN
jgi:hypothetical protein